MNCSFVKMINFGHDPSDYVVPQSHEEYEIVYYSSGKGKTTINGETHDFGPGDIAFIAPNVLHDERTFEQAEVYCILFKMEGVELQSSFIKYNEVISNRIFEILKTVLNEYIKQGFNYNDYIKYSVYQIIILIERYFHSQREKRAFIKSDKLVNYAKEVIKHNFNSKINFELLSENLGYSYDRFRHIFKTETSITMKQYQLEVRLNHAKKMLIETDMSISEITNSLGFRNLVSFTQFFTSRMAISPSAYREKINSKIDEYVNLGVNK